MICAFDQACPNGIFADIMPFFRVALATSQDMIEESALPDGIGRTSFDGSCKEPLQSPDPITEFKVIWQHHK